MENSVPYLLAGSIAGLVSDGLVHPIDTIRARLQVQRITSAIPTTAAATTSKLTATGLGLRIVRQEGLGSLYKGFGAVATGTIPGHALYFAGYEVSKEYLARLPMFSPDTPSSKFTLPLVAGFLADVFGSLAWTPMDVVKQRMQVRAVTGESTSTTPTTINTANTTTNTTANATRRISSLQAFRTIVRTEGPLGLYRGFGAGLLTYGPYVSIYFALYEHWKRVFRERHHLVAGRWLVNPYRDMDRPPFFLCWTGAALSGGFSAVLTCPLDVIKTRVQTSSKSAVGYENTLAAVRTILREEGPRTFFQGVKPRALWMASGTAITMVVYEELKAAMSIRQRKMEQ